MQTGIKEIQKQAWLGGKVDPQGIVQKINVWQY